MQPLLKGTPARMAILDYGLFKVHENGRVIGICGYLVQTTEGETVLIDTGFPAKYAKDAAAATAEDGLHVGFMDGFPGVPILMAAAERALPRPLYWSGKQPMEWPEAEYILIEEDTLVGPGFEVLHVPGHTPGQLAFQLDLPETGTVLLTSDAISRASELDTEFAGSWDAALAKQQARELIARASRERATLIFGHSPEQWPKLKKAPEWYP